MDCRRARTVIRLRACDTWGRDDRNVTGSAVSSPRDYCVEPVEEGPQQVPGDDYHVAITSGDLPADVVHALAHDIEVILALTVCVIALMVVAGVTWLAIRTRQVRRGAPITARVVSPRYPRIRGLNWRVPAR